VPGEPLRAAGDAPRPGATPAALGYRWPAEWEPHRATWLSWPHNRDTWPGRLEPVVETFVAIAAALAGHEALCVAVADGAVEDGARRALARGGVDADRHVEFHRIPTHDAWARDHGPIFVVRERVGATAPGRAVVDFRFDNWGRKYPGWEPDDAVPRQVAEALGVPRFAPDVVIEGGAIDGNGEGVVLTTESCLLNPNRGAGRTRERMERVLHDFLAVDRVVWLAGGIEGDDTDGHVDDVARFVAPDTVVAAVCDDPGDPNHAVLAENRRRLAAATGRRGARLAIVELPMPPRVTLAGDALPASYANFYLANGVALVPTFGAPSDARALSILRELLPGRDAIGVPSSDLVVGLGAIHCVTQQEPDARRSRA
jgi:agmatine deiminase